MTRRALRPAGRGLRAATASLTAPVLGWNTRENMVSMDARFARVLDNLLVDGGRIGTRKGYARAAEAQFLPRTLAAYDWGGQKKLLAAGGGKIWEVDFAAKTCVSAGEGFLSDKWNTVFYKGYLYFLNGQDHVQVYHDGALAAAEFTGATEGADLDAARLCAGALHRNRLFFIEKESLAFWYTQNAGNVKGPLVKFDLAQLSKYGGELRAAIGWTYSVSSGAQESQLIFITSEGEAFVYAGDNPGEAAAWALRGTYKIPRPVGARCVCAVGGDVFYLGEDGYYLLSQLLSAPAAQRTAAFSDAINPTVLELKNSFKNDGWTMQPYQSAGLLIINVPRTGADTEQHVLNLQSGAWCRFTGMRAMDWAELDGKLYFCGPAGGGPAGGVYQALTGRNDDGKSIDWRFMGAYSSLGVPYAKAIKEIQLYFQGQKELRFNVSASVDFKRESVVYTASPAALGSSWDASDWDVTPWAAEAAAVKKRIIPRLGQGTYFSFGCNGSVLDTDMYILGYDVFFEHGKNLA